MSNNQSKSLDIIKKATFHAPIQKVWNAIATSEGINAWFMPNDFKQEKGAEFTIQSPFGPTSCKVLELDPPNRLSFSWGDAGWIVTFELKKEGAHTNFTLTHAGWGAPDEVIQGQGPGLPNAVIRDNMNGGWEAIVNEKLRKVVED